MALPPASSRRVYALDVLRGIAALAIFVFHFFALYPFARGEGLAATSTVVLSYFAMGVPLFYALSGLSLYLAFDGEGITAEFLRKFYLRRFLRIAPLFYAVTIVWLLIFVSRGAKIDPGKLIATVTFCFNLIPGLHESYVAAGWSVGVEMIFYTVFPLVLMSVRRFRSALLFFSASALLAIVVYPFLTAKLPGSSYPGLAFPSHLLFFATGIVAYFASRSPAEEGRLITRRPALFWSGVGLVAGLIFLLCSGWVTKIPGLGQSTVSRTLWSLPIGVALIVACEVRAQNWLIRLFARLGECSYSLYLLHPIAIYFVTEYLKANPDSQLASESRFLLWLGLTLLALIGASALSYLAIEAPFQRWGRRLTSNQRQTGRREGESPPEQYREIPALTRTSTPVSKETEPKGLALAIGIIVLACAAFHFWGATRSWHNTLLGQFSFRQSQTALVADYILRDGYHLDYLVPIFGPPWSIPMEFPVYQLIVAGVVKLLDVPLEQTGRAVSLLFFYLSLIPAWFLLKTLRVSRIGRLFALGLLVTSPLYLFFAGTFLIETTALFFSLAYAAIASGSLRSPTKVRILSAVAFGSLAGLAKITTFCVGFGFILMFSALWCWERRDHLGTTIRAILPRLVLICVVPLCVAMLWTSHADKVKAQNPTPMARVLESSNMRTWHYGSIEQRLSPDFWSRMYQHGLANITTSALPWLVAIVLLVLLPKARLQALMLFAAYVSGPFVFSNIYFVHDYYWVANAAFLLAAIAVPLGALAGENGYRPMVATGLFIALVASNVWGFQHSNFRSYQRNNDTYLRDVAQAIQLCTTKSDVIMIIGQNYDSALVYYSARRAIMPWARGFEANAGTKAAVNALQGEGRRLGLLVISGNERQDAPFIDYVTKLYGFAPTPVFDDYKTALYLPDDVDAARRGSAADTLLGLPLVAKQLMIPPKMWVEDGELVWLLHAPSRVELALPVGAHSVHLKYGLSRKSYTNGGTTDGAEFIVSLVKANQATETLLQRNLRPAGQAADQGLQEFTAEFSPADGSRLILETRDGGTSNAWDWTLWSGLEIR